MYTSIRWGGGVPGEGEGVMTAGKGPWVPLVVCNLPAITGQCGIALPIYNTTSIVLHL